MQRTFAYKGLVTCCFVTTLALFAVGCEDDKPEKTCDRVLKVCAWNEETLDFDRDCQFMSACELEAGVGDAATGATDAGAAERSMAD